MNPWNRVQNLRLRDRLVLSVALMAALFFLVLYAGFLAANSSNRRIKQAYEETNAKTIAAWELDNAYSKNLVMLVDKLDSGVYPWEVGPQRLSEIEGNIRDNLAFLRHISLDREEQDLAADIFSKTDSAGEFTGKLKEALQRRDGAALRALRPRLYPSVDPLSYSVRQFLDYELGKSKRLVQESDAAFRNAYRWIIGLSLLLVALLSALALWVMDRQILHPILALSRATEKIVAEGDLTQKIETGSQDEVGRLARDFSQMVEKLREIPLGLRESAQKLSQSLAGLERATEEQNRSVTVQAAALQETQVTAQQIKQTSQVASQKAGDILQMAEKANEIGRMGGESVEQSLQGLMEIRRQVQEMAGRIEELNDRTRQIGSITETVKDLADQSNMLALNAAIEAVRSGEHGKGFGLVAREIRRLADQSLQATVRVQEILDGIGGAIDKLVQITESGSARMESGLAQVKNSGENLKALVNVIQENGDSVRQIANAVNQQNTGIGQIFTAVRDQNGMMEDTLKRLESTAAAVQVMREVAKSVSEIVGSYKV